MKKNHLIQAMLLSALFGCGATLSHAADQAPAQSAGASSMQNNTQGEKFMESNKTKKDVVTLPSGLQYEVLTKGTGKKPGKNDVVTVDYEGRLVNGEIFDSSYKRGQPASFPVSGVIAGWTEALQLMNEGSTWMLYIPPTLAYGAAGAGGVIGPNETLVFKVHLISVK